MTQIRDNKHFKSYIDMYHVTCLKGNSIHYRHLVTISSFCGYLFLNYNKRKTNFIQKDILL